MEKNKIEITVKYLLKLIINHQFDLIFENDLFKKISKENFEEEVLAHPENQQCHLFINSII